MWLNTPASALIDTSNLYTDRRTDRLIPVYLRIHSVFGGILNITGEQRSGSDCTYVLADLILLTPLKTRMVDKKVQDLEFIAMNMKFEYVDDFSKILFADDFSS